MTGGYQYLSIDSDRNLPLVSKHLGGLGPEVGLHLDVQVDLLVAADPEARQLLLDSERPNEK